ncbi:MAG TPA: hypothetical protein VI564_06995 [Candidatus Nanoarchaeia archaeon]|nr:hypothetical protein [Candidatus Nanoarchaeia archaeon]
MKEGAIAGALIALLVYFMLPIYSPDGIKASILPTGNVVSSDSARDSYFGNIPFSLMVFFALEILGISIGIVAQRAMSKSYY